MEKEIPNPASIFLTPVRRENEVLITPSVIEVGISALLTIMPWKVIFSLSSAYFFEFHTVNQVNAHEDY